MSDDARFSVGFPSHPKTKKLVRRLGVAGAWHFVCLILWTASNRSDGSLVGMSDEDIELAVDWAGDAGAFVNTLVEIKFLDGEEDLRTIHDWQEHNPWAAGSEQRSEKSRWAALCKRYGRPHAAREMPDYAARMDVASQGQKLTSPTQPKDSQEHATGTKGQCDEHGQALPEDATGMPLAESGTPPSPSPLPIPNPTPTLNTPLPPKGGKRSRRSPEFEEALAKTEGFAEFYDLYPKKDKGPDALKAYRQVHLHEKADERALMMLGLAKWRVHEQWTKEGGHYVPLPATWLRNLRWRDETVCAKPTVLPLDAAGRPWFVAAGFDDADTANNYRCYPHNAHEFRHRVRIEEQPA